MRKDNKMSTKRTEKRSQFRNKSLVHRDMPPDGDCTMIGQAGRTAFSVELSSLFFVELCEIIMLFFADGVSGFDAGSIEHLCFCGLSF